MDDQLKKVYEGDVSENIVSFWFTLLGYVAAIVALEVVAKSNETLALSIAANLSYIFVFIWLKVKTDRTIWWLYPKYRPTSEKVSNKATIVNMVIGGAVSVTLCILIYQLVKYLVKSLI